MKQLKNISPIAIAGVAVLFLAWIWLAWVVLSRGPVTLVTIFWVVASGIIVFVPMWKKLSSGTSKDK